MKVLPFKIPKTIESSIHVQIDRQPYFYDTLHQHPEIQITLILEGTGTLFQGEYIGDYTPGDVFIIGANVPHVLKSDALHYDNDKHISHAVSVFFDEESLGRNFFHLPELSEINQLLVQSNRGLKLHGTCKAEVGTLIKEIKDQQAIDKVISLLNILKNITLSTETRYLSDGFAQHRIDESEGVRLNTIFQFTMNEYHRPIKLDEVADMANMTVPAFCRYFRQRTRKTYVNFLNELRIAQACKLLFQQDENIAQVAFQCGFGNLSHFNRVFKKIHGISPKAYRKRRIGIV